jgi:hypothetical protein
MTTLLRYRGYGGEPCCEVSLESGEHVLIAVDAAGVTIRRLARGDMAEEMLFRGAPSVVADICLALLDGRPASAASVLDIFLAVVSQFQSATDIRAAFAEATGRG